MRLRIATEQARVAKAGGVSLVIAKSLWEAVQIVVAAGAASELSRSVKLLLDLVTKLIERAQALAATYESGQLMQHLELQMLEAHDRALSELLRRIDAGSPPEAPWGAFVASGDPVAQKTGAALIDPARRPWWQVFLSELWRQLRAVGA